MANLIVILYLTLFAAIISFILAGDDCYKFSKAEFTTIVDCEHGCEYVFKNEGSKMKRISGGCSKTKESGCRKGENGATVCTCQGDHCNLGGYMMEHSAESDEQ